MSKSPPHETTRPEQAPLTPEQLQRQLASMHNQVYDSLRTHFEQTRTREETASRGIVPWLRRHRTDLYFVVTLLLLIGVWWLKPGSGKNNGSTPNPTDTATVDNHPGPAPNAIRSKLSEVFNDPEGGFRAYLVYNGIRANAWMDSANAAVAPDIQKTLRTIRGQKPANWSTDDLKFVRNTLLCYMYRLWARQQNGATAADFPVDPAFDQFDPDLLKKLAGRLDLSDVVGDSSSAGNDGFRSTIVVRWMQSYATENKTY